MLRNLIIISLVLVTLLSCKDEGKSIERPKVNPEDGMSLIKRFKSPPRLAYKNGEDVCFGDWSFKIYKKCDHRFHGVNEEGKVNKLRTHLMGFRADSKEEALEKCESYVEDYNLPLGVKFIGAEVSHRGSNVYDCFTQRQSIVNNEKRSPYCGLMKINNKKDLPEDLQDLTDLDFLTIRKEGKFIIQKGLFNIQSLRQREGFVQFSCSTCDDLTVHTAKDFEEKFVCLMDKFLELEESSVIDTQNRIKRDVRNFNKTTTIDFDITNKEDSEEDDVLDILGLDDENNEAEMGDDVIPNPEFEEESKESKAERELKTARKEEVMKGLSCLRKYYGKLLNKDQSNGIIMIEEKYNIECDVRKK